MKRSALLFGALLLGAASVANAQGLTMQMSNGWNFSFSGNVNIFAMYQSQSDDGQISSPGTLTGVGGKGFYMGTGLLPAFATFEAKGKEGNTDLGVHFGFAPQVQCGGGKHDCFGAQIDMRQVFLTVGGSWGQILAGKELGLFNRGNILADQTLYGVGGGGIAPGGTTLGRIGYGYIYPNFVGQITYSSAAGKPTQFSVGLFDPSALDANYYHETVIPRVEAEITHKAGKVNLFVNGTVQYANDPATDESETAFGGGGGLTYKTGTFSLHGSGYYGTGIGTTLQFSGVGPALGGLGVDANGDLRNSYGYYGQLTFTPTDSKATFAASYGSSFLESADNEPDFKTENTLISGGIYYQATKSLKLVGEGDYMWTDDKDASGSPDKNTAFTGSFGFMLFY